MRKSLRVSSSEGSTSGSITISSSSSESRAYGSLTRRCFRTGPPGSWERWALLLTAIRFVLSRSAVREFVEDCVIFDAAKLSCVLATDAPDPTPSLVFPFTIGLETDR